MKENKQEEEIIIELSQEKMDEYYTDMVVSEFKQMIELFMDKYELNYPDIRELINHAEAKHIHHILQGNIDRL